MVLQAHEGQEALHEPLRAVEAGHCACSACGEMQFSFGAHVHISSEASGKQKTRWLEAYRVL